MADARLGPEEWVRVGLKALASSGASALKADTLAAGLGVSRGSFYWHFADVSAFHAAVLDRWREVALENIIRDIEATNDPFEALLNRAFSDDTAIERAVRAWATADTRARQAVETIDAARTGYLQKLLIADGVPRDIAATRARALNWTYLGFAISSSRLTGDSRRRMIRELSILFRR